MAEPAAPADRRIEDYALIGDMRTVALVGRDGAIDWLCLPRIDGPACFAALLGDAENGRWRVAPREQARSVTRRYVDGTLVLETEFATASGRVRLTDFMALPRDETLDVVRIVTGLEGSVPMCLDARFRFDYGRIVPWVRQSEGATLAIAGPDALRLATPIALEGRGFSTVAEFTISAGDSVPMVLTWFRSYDEPPRRHEAGALLDQTIAAWRAWSTRCKAPARWRDTVVRSAITLKALTHHKSGGIIAAATTSLPERLGGMRNWDYRYCWLRDATFTLYALMATGYTEEAREWRKWLVRAAAGEPSKLQIMYGLAGERRLAEYEVPWLEGFAGSAPVRIGNAAHVQRQLDVYGEIMDSLNAARAHGLEADDDSWRVQQALMAFVEDRWREPGAGMWEQRGAPHRFVHSAVMAWVAADRAVKAVERFGLDGPAERWRALRETIREEVCTRGFDRRRGTFTQTFGGKALDASLLLIPLVGFLPPDDARVTGTVEAIRRELMRDGFLLRYDTDEGDDGLPPGEGAFLACTLWLADNFALMGRMDEATTLFERVLAVRNDVGLLAEEYDPVGRRQLGNFPQAFSHVAVINTAHNLTSRGAAHRRSETATGGSGRGG
ncbi:MAG: glycoside hydrolase family 15 protein [Candidatus Eiseniibacteriota bacterium]